LFPLAAAAAIAFFFVAAIFMIPDLAIAASADPATGPAPADGEQATTCTCPDALSPETKEKIWPRPKFADLKTSLDVSDEIAALESVQLALSEVGDGSTYVWHRYHGRLSGVVQPTASFRDNAGNVCRHIVVVLSAGTRSRRTEGIACRLGTGQWQLQG
jgi:hypothetical protein